MALFNKKNSSDPKKSLDRTGRLLSDYKRITDVFKSHPHISIKEVFGAPPERYHLLYKIDGLEKAKNTIEVKNEHLVEISLPPGYPGSVPVCKRVTPLFHPNVSDDLIDVKKFWQPDAHLADLIVTIGEMIAFQKYDTENPLSADAAKWADRNRSILPLCKDDLRYREPAPVHEEPSKPQVFLGDEESLATPPPEDGRKTEGIVIDTGTEQISVQGETISATPRNLEMRETAVLQKGKPETTVIVTPVMQESGPQAAVSSGKPKSVEPDHAEGVHEPTEDHKKSQAAATSSHKPADFAADSFIPVSESVLPGSRNRKLETFSADQSVHCTLCGHPNHQTANFCSNCGTKLRREFPRLECPLPKVLLLAALFSIPVAALAVAITLFATNQTRPVAKAMEMPLVPASAPQQPIPQAQVSPAPPPASVKDTGETAKQPVRAPEASAPKALRPASIAPEQKQAKIDEALKTAQTYLNLGSLDEAQNKFLLVLKLDPKNDDALDGLEKIRDAKDKAQEDSAKAGRR